MKHTEDESSLPYHSGTGLISLIDQPTMRRWVFGIQVKYPLSKIPAGMGQALYRYVCKFCILCRNVLSMMLSIDRFRRSKAFDPRLTRSSKFSSISETSQTEFFIACLPIPHSQFVLNYVFTHCWHVIRSVRIKDTKSDTNHH